mgnify:CR=1 FL=1
MKNKSVIILFLSILILDIFYPAYSDEFNFNVTELEITENGNIIKGINGGVVNSNKATLNFCSISLNVGLSVAFSSKQSRIMCFTAGWGTSVALTVTGRNVPDATPPIMRSLLNFLL